MIESTHKAEVLEERMGYDLVPFTRWERFCLWADGVRIAIRTKPEKTWSRPKVLKKGDAGYDEARLIVRRSSFFQYSLTRAGTVDLTPEEFSKLGK